MVYNAVIPLFSETVASMWAKWSGWSLFGSLMCNPAVGNKQAWAQGYGNRVLKGTFLRWILFTKCWYLVFNSVCNISFCIRANISAIVIIFSTFYWRSWSPENFPSSAIMMFTFDCVQSFDLFMTKYQQSFQQSKKLNKVNMVNGLKSAW